MVHRQDKQRKHRSRHVFLWVCAAVIIFLVGSDLFLRFAYGAGNPIMVVYDRPAGYILKPDQDVRRFGGHNVFINHEGMRADPIPASKPAGTERVFFIGDSVTYGSTRLSQNEIFSERIHRALPALVHHPVQVLNASASAWAIGNEWGYLNSRGTFDSDLVILVLNSGDITEPFATIKDIGDGVVTVKPWCALDEVYTRVIKGRVLHLIRTEDKGTEPESTGAEQQAINLKDLTSFDAFIEAHHARMAIVFVPFRKFVPTGAPASAPPELTNWAIQHRVPLLDTTSVLSPKPVPAVSYDGFHLTSLGHALVAQDIEAHWAALSPPAK